MTPRRQVRLPVRDLDMAVSVQGDGPLVLLCHGFPETSWSWRHQQRALADAGYRSAAPDLRGYGATMGPAQPAQCDVVSLAEDLVELVAALGGGPCHLVGHDFGALLAWHAAALHPDVFRTVTCLSVGFPSFLTGPTPPLRILAERMAGAFHYILYFQQPGLAEAELEADVRASLAKIFWASAGEAPEGASITFRPTPVGRTTLLADTPLPPTGAMAWMDAADFDAYVAAFSARGFAGPLAWYRAMDLGWKNLGERRCAKVTVPALYVVGTHDVVFRTTGGLLARMRDAVPNLDRIVTLEGCGHWTQQERPTEVSAALIAFLRTHG